MKLETYEKAQRLRKQIKQLQGTRDALTALIDRHTNQMDMIDDNDEASREDLSVHDTRDKVEKIISELEHEFESL